METSGIIALVGIAIGFLGICYIIYDCFKDKSKVVTLKHIKLISDRHGIRHYEYIKKPSKDNYKQIIKELEDNWCIVRMSHFIEFIK